MTLDSTVARVTENGDGSSTTIPFPYYFLDDEDLTVLKQDDETKEITLLAINTHYTVVDAGEPDGGSVELVDPMDLDFTYTVIRTTEPTQDLDLRNNDDMPAEEVEKRLDRLAMVAQRLFDLADRSLKLLDGSTDGISMTLPEELTPECYLRLNEDGTGWELVEGTTILSSITGDVLLVANNLNDLADVPTARTNMGLLKVTGTSSAPTVLSASDNLAPTAGFIKEIIYVQSDGGAVQVPGIDAGTADGQEIVVIGCSDTDTLEFLDGNDTDQNGDHVLGAGWALTYVWDDTANLWRQTSISERA